MVAAVSQFPSHSAIAPVQFIAPIHGSFRESNRCRRPSVMDVGLEAVDWAHNWIQAVSHKPLAQTK